MRHLVNAYEVKVGTVFLAGNTVWSMPEPIKVVCIPCNVLYKCSASSYLFVFLTQSGGAYTLMPPWRWACICEQISRNVSRTHSIFNHAESRVNLRSSNASFHLGMANWINEHGLVSVGKNLVSIIEMFRCGWVELVGFMFPRTIICCFRASVFPGNGYFLFHYFIIYFLSLAAYL